MRYFNSNQASQRRFRWHISWGVENTIVPMSASTFSPAAKEILEYLLAHPESQDTLEGIVRVWILRQRININTNEVKEVVEQLVRKGYLVETSDDYAESRESVKSYRLNWATVSEIRAKLGDKQEPEMRPPNPRGT